jgi:Translation elongation factors (GTPases)
MCQRSTWTQLKTHARTNPTGFQPRRRSRRGSPRRARSHAGVVEGGHSRQTIANKFVPVIGGSALKNIGIQYLVDAVVDYLPSPLDIPPAKGQNPDTGEPMEAMTDDNGDFCSIASSCGAIRLSGNWCSSAFIPAPQQRRHCLQSAHEQT